MSVRTLSAVEWICDTCHDTGLARTLPDAAEALGEHMEDYHAPANSMTWEELEADDEPPSILTYDGTVILP